VNGGWSDWSKWENCSQVGGDGTTGDCKCRSRSCDNPKPYYGGQPCNGASVEVTNCTGKVLIIIIRYILNDSKVYNYTVNLLYLYELDNNVIFRYTLYMEVQ
jgi:hypothetical protein